MIFIPMGTKKIFVAAYPTGNDQLAGIQRKGGIIFRLGAVDAVAHVLQVELVISQRMLTGIIQCKLVGLFAVVACFYTLLFEVRRAEKLVDGIQRPLKFAIASQADRVGQVVIL